MPNVEEIVFQALFEASMCWVERPRGEFDSTRAMEVGERLVAAIKDHYATVNVPQALPPAIEKNTHYVQLACEYMTLLIDAGFHVQTVLSHGFEYMFALYPDRGTDRHGGSLFAARIVKQASRNLLIDAESQLYELHRSSRAI